MVYLFYYIFFKIKSIRNLSCGCVSVWDDRLDDCVTSLVVLVSVTQLLHGI